ncbi:phage tail tape measure protein [Zooshikella sp. RANM57]|uniref:phage tail tape measure protein n=1 Tax=Zooshikella sp. RANM57 TaxID=3425863 RepID=UPI003D6F2763
MSGQLQNIAGASGQVVDSLRRTQERLRSVDAQASQFNAFRQLKRQTASTSAALTSAQRNVASLALKMRDSGESVKSLRRDFLAAERKVATLAQELEAAGEPSDILRYKFKQAQEEASRLSSEFRKAEREGRSLSRQFESAKSDVTRLQQAQVGETQQLQELRQALNRAGVSTRNLAAHQSQARQESNRLNQQLDSQARRLERIAQIESRVSQARERMQRGMQVSANITVAAFGAQQASQSINRVLGGPLRVAADFEEKMSGVAAVARASDSELEVLTKTARKLGAETSYSASESAEGMKFLAMAGFKTNQVIAAMPGLLNLAKAGATDLGGASDIASDILSGFGLKPEQMSRVSDVLTATFTTANTNLSMLGETMKYVAPVARQAGMGLEETAAMAGLLGNVGIKGSQAGTTLRAMITRLAAPARSGAKTLSRLGVSAKDSSGDMRNLVEVIGDIAAATENMGSAEKLQVLKSVFGEEPAAGMAELLSQEGAKGITKYLEVINSADGRAAEVAKKMGNNANGRLKEFASAVESLNITIADALLPTLKNAIVWITAIIRRIEQWAAEHPELVRVLTITASAFGAIAAACVPLLLVTASLNSIFAIFAFSMEKISAISELMNSRFRLLTVSQWSLNAAFLANPITWIVAAVVALIAVIGVLIYKYFEPLKAFLTGFWEGFLQGIYPVIESFSPLFAALSPIGDALAWVWQNIKAVWNWFVNLLQPVQYSAESLESAKNSGVSFGQFVAEALNVLLFPIKLLMAGLGNLVKLISWAADVGSGCWDSVKEGALSLWESLKSVFEWSPIKLIVKGWGTAFDWIRGKLDWLDGAVSKVKSFFGFSDDNEESDSAGEANLEQIVKSSKSIEQSDSVNNLKRSKAVAVAGAVSAGVISAPVPALEPVPLPETYQKTLNQYQVQGKSTSSVQLPVSIPSVVSGSGSQASKSVSISIGQLDINIESNQGLNAHEVADEVRKQFMKLMRDVEAKGRGELYDG